MSPFVAGAALCVGPFYLAGIVDSNARVSAISADENDRAWPAQGLHGGLCRRLLR